MPKLIKPNCNTMSEVIKTYIQKEANRLFLNEYPDAPINDLQESEQSAYRSGVKDGLSSGIELAKEFAEWMDANYTTNGAGKWMDWVEDKPILYTTTELFEMFLIEKQKEGK